MEEFLEANPIEKEKDEDEDDDEDEDENKTKINRELVNLTNVYSALDYEVSTGGFKRGDLSVKTAWTKSTGVDA